MIIYYGRQQITIINLNYRQWRAKARIMYLVNNVMYVLIMQWSLYIIMYGGRGKGEGGRGKGAYTITK